MGGAFDRFLENAPPPPMEARSSPLQSPRRVLGAVSGQRRPPALLSLSLGGDRASGCGTARSGAEGRRAGAGRAPRLPSLPSSQPLGAPGFRVGCGVTSAMAGLAPSQWVAWPEVCSLLTTWRPVGLI